MSGNGSTIVCEPASGLTPGGGHLSNSDPVCIIVPNNTGPVPTGTSGSLIPASQGSQAGLVAGSTISMATTSSPPAAPSGFAWKCSIYASGGSLLKRCTLTQITVGSNQNPPPAAPPNPTKPPAPTPPTVPPPPNTPPAGPSPTGAALSPYACTLGAIYEGAPNGGAFIFNGNTVQESFGSDGASLFGLTTLTPEQINDTGFGVQFAAKGSPGTVQINDIQVRVYYEDTGVVSAPATPTGTTTSELNYNCVFTDDSGNILIGTNQGLLYRQSGQEVFSAFAGFPIKNVSKIGVVRVPQLGLRLMVIGDGGLCAISNSGQDATNGLLVVDSSTKANLVDIQDGRAAYTSVITDSSGHTYLPSFLSVSPPYLTLAPQITSVGTQVT